MDLPDDIYDKVVKLSEEGNEELDSGKLNEAMRLFEKAAKLLPKPVTQWDAACWLFGSTGDIYFQLADYENARQSLQIAVASGDGNENPFIHLRLGQSLYELGIVDLAGQHLVQAFMLEGEEIFESEPACYLDFLRSKIELTDSL